MAQKTGLVAATLGSDQNHPIYVRNVPPDTHAGTSDPGSIAEQQTATYTQDLTYATLLLFIGTLVALFVGEVQRRAGASATEKAQSTQRAHDRELQAELIAQQERERATEAAARRAEDDHRRTAVVSQIIATLQSYERAIELLLMAPHYPIASRARTLEVLFQQSLTADMIGALLPELRSEVFRTLVKAQETLQASADNQQFYDSMVDALKRQAIIMTGFIERLRVANEQVVAIQSVLSLEMDPKRQVQLQEELREALRRVEDVKASPDQFDAVEYAQTVDARTKKLNATYPTITANAQDAKAALVATRRLFGDDVNIRFEITSPVQPHEKNDSEGQ